MWHIKVIWKNGEEELLKEGSKPANFYSMVEAQKMRDFLLQGIEDDVQSINIVKQEIKLKAKQHPTTDLH